jgi:hypothetical protein
VSDDNDARFLITNAVMPRLDSLDKNMGKIFDRIDNVCTTTGDLKITDEIIKAKIAAIEMMNIQTQEAVTAMGIRMDKHSEDMIKHFNPYFGETLQQKLWRKKSEIAAGGGLGTFLAAVLYFLIDKFGG